MHTQVAAQHADWCRQSLCSIEGDILISNIDVVRSDSSEYLIPSLLVLKRKVDKVFGSQKVVSLSENRANVNERTCCDERGQHQFELFAKTILHQKGVVYKEPNEIPPARHMEIGSDVESVASSLDFSITETELLQLLTEEERNDIQACQVQQEQQLQQQMHQSMEESEMHSSILLSFISQFEKSVEVRPALPRENEENKTVLQYTYQIQPPARALDLHEQAMKKNGIALYHYNPVVTKKEFNTTQFLNETGSSVQSNRILFWKELLKEQIDLE